MRSGRAQLAPYVGPPWYAAAGWLVVALLLQATLLHAVAIHSVVPSAVLVVVIWYAIRVDARRAALYGLIAGLAEDLLAASTGSAWMISTMVVAVLAGLLSRGFFADSIPLVGAITVVTTLVRALLFWTIMALEGYPPGLGAMHFHEALLQAALNAVLMTVAMLIARRFDNGARE